MPMVKALMVVRVKGSSHSGFECAAATGKFALKPAVTARNCPTAA